MKSTLFLNILRIVSIGWGCRRQTSLTPPPPPGGRAPLPGGKPGSTDYTCVVCDAFIFLYLRHTCLYFHEILNILAEDLTCCKSSVKKWISWSTTASRTRLLIKIFTFLKVPKVPFLMTQANYKCIWNFQPIQTKLVRSGTSVWNI